MEKELKQIFRKPFIGAIIGDVNSGKSNYVYHLIDVLKANYRFNLVVYGLRNEIAGSHKIHSVAELETVKNSIIFIDEFFTMFDLNDRKKRQQVESSLRLINHNNNILMLIGLPENFKKFISAKVTVIFYKQVKFEDFINGSGVKNTILNYQGYEKGSTLLNLAKGETIVYNGSYKKLKIPYLKKYDSKKDNVAIFVQKASRKKRGTKNVLRRKK